jgi:hypothetical protein
MVIINIAVFLILKIIATTKNSNNLHRIAEYTFSIVFILVMIIMLVSECYA